MICVLLSHPTPFPFPIVYKGVNKIRIKFISSSLVMEDGSPERSTDITTPTTNNQLIFHPQINYENASPNRRVCLEITLAN